MGARAPFQVLVLPYRTSPALELAVFRRVDGDVWQFVAGGGVVGESVEEAARREGFEEAAIPTDSRCHRLASRGSVPVECFDARETWPSGLTHVPEYCFAVEVSGRIELSREHDRFEWLGVDAALERLTFESNRSAATELRRRLVEGRWSLLPAAGLVAFTALAACSLHDEPSANSDSTLDESADSSSTTDGACDDDGVSLGVHCYTSESLEDLGTTPVGVNDPDDVGALAVHLDDGVFVEVDDVSGAHSEMTGLPMTAKDLYSSGEVVYPVLDLDADRLRVFEYRGQFPTQLEEVALGNFGPVDWAEAVDLDNDGDSDLLTFEVLDNDRIRSFINDGGTLVPGSSLDTGLVAHRFRYGPGSKGGQILGFDLSGESDVIINVDEEGNLVELARFASRGSRFVVESTKAESVFGVLSLTSIPLDPPSWTVGLLDPTEDGSPNILRSVEVMGDVRDIALVPSETSLPCVVILRGSDSDSELLAGCPGPESETSLELSSSLVVPGAWSEVGSIALDDTRCLVLSGNGSLARLCGSRSNGPK